MSGKHRTWSRAQRKALNATTGRILTWARDGVRRQELHPDQAKSVAKYTQAILSARPHRVRQAQADLNVSIPSHLLAEIAAVAGDGIL
jgi:hypothetical protein